MQERHVVLKDLGSHLGISVNGERIGGQSQYLTAPLKEGENEVVFGSNNSPHRFLFTVNEHGEK